MLINEIGCDVLFFVGFEKVEVWVYRLILIVRSLVFFKKFWLSLEEFWFKMILFDISVDMFFRFVW